MRTTTQCPHKTMTNGVVTINTFNALGQATTIENKLGGTTLSAFSGMCQRALGGGTLANLVIGIRGDILKHGYPASSVAANRAQIVKTTEHSGTGLGHGAERDDCSQSACRRPSDCMPGV
jgi:hypothetical protein